MLKPGRLYAYALITRILPETRFFKFKALLLRWCGAKLGENVRICSSVKIMGTGKLVVGDNVFIGHGAFISSGSKIAIGDNVDIAPYVYIATGTHEIDMEREHTAGLGRHDDIKIGAGVWLCARAIIMPGTTIGRKSLIAAGAVLCRNVEERCMYAGVPAKFKKQL